MDDIEFAIASSSHTVEDMIPKLRSQVALMADRDQQLARELGQEIETLSQSVAQLISIASKWHEVAG